MKKALYFFLLSLLPLASTEAGSKEAVDHLILNAPKLLHAMHDTTRLPLFFPKKDSFEVLLQKKRGDLTKKEVAWLAENYLAQIS